MLLQFGELFGLKRAAVMFHVVTSAWIWEQLIQNILIVATSLLHEGGPQLIKALQYSSLSN